jgi:TatD DNase family protein
MAWIDTHAHLEDESLRNRLLEVLERCQQNRVDAIISVGTTLQTSKGCVAIAETYPNVFATAGIHPNYCNQVEASDWSEICNLVNHPRVVAIGETGLDRYWDDCPWEIQLDYFRRHCELSRETRLPLVIHMRDCASEMLEQLQAAAKDNQLIGVMHSFTGDLQMARACIDLGLYISFAGMLTYKKSDELRRVASELPLDRLLIETDSPYLSPEPQRSMRPNMPSQVLHTATCLAQARKISLDELSMATIANTKRLFSKMSL